MKVLVVDGFGLSSAGRVGWNSFRRCVDHMLERNLPGSSVVFRRCDNISEYLLPEPLEVKGAEDEINVERREQNVQARMNCMRYDELGLICVGGDMKEIVPWDPIFAQVNALLFQASLFDTPVFGSGIGAFAGIYSIATQGVELCMVNGPTGNTLDKLDTYPRYFFSPPSSSSSSSSPNGRRGCWLSSDTGDVYSFDPKNQVWRGICNVGIHRVDYSIEDVDAEEEHGTKATIRSSQRAHLRNDELIENPFLIDIPSQNFDVRHTSKWRLHKSDSLLSQGQLVVIADDERGHPVLLGHQSQLFSVCPLDEGIGYSSWEQIFGNLCSIVSARSVQETRKSMQDFNPTTFRRPEMWPPSSSLPIATSLPSGPTPIKISTQPLVSLKPESVSHVKSIVNNTANLKLSISQRFHGPQKNYVNTGIEPLFNINTVGYVESLTRSKSDFVLLVKDYDNGWKVPRHRCKEMRPPEPYQQESLTPWQQMTFDAEVTMRASKGLAPPKSPTVSASKQSDSLSLTTDGSSSLNAGSELERLLAKQNLLQRRTKRLQRGVEMTDMTPTATPLQTSRNHLSSAGTQSLRVPRSASTPLVRSHGQPFTGAKFDKQIKIGVGSESKKSSSPTADMRDFLGVGGQRLEILEVNKLSLSSRPGRSGSMDGSQSHQSRQTLVSHRNMASGGAENEEASTGLSSAALNDLDDERSLNSVNSVNSQQS